MASWTIVALGRDALEGSAGEGLGRALDRVGPLFQSMVDHHRTVAGKDWPVRASEEAWRRRRREYEEWLATDRAWLLLASDPSKDANTAVGYAVLRLHRSGPSWDLGDDIAELESLAVAPDARGDGLGAALMDFAREHLRSRGIRFWTVAVVEANAGAVRFYEREGFRPYYRQMLAPL